MLLAFMACAAAIDTLAVSFRIMISSQKRQNAFHRDARPHRHFFRSSSERYISLLCCTLTSVSFRQEGTGDYTICFYRVTEMYDSDLAKWADCRIGRSQLVVCLDVYAAIPRFSRGIWLCYGRVEFILMGEPLDESSILAVNAAVPLSERNDDGVRQHSGVLADWFGGCSAKAKLMKRQRQ